jgi:hypothetical protein
VDSPDEEMTPEQQAQAEQLRKALEDYDNKKAQKLIDGVKSWANKNKPQ